jgi:PAP_fibrillin
MEPSKPLAFAGACATGPLTATPRTFVTTSRPSTVRAARRPGAPRMQTGGDAEDEAPSDSFVPQAAAAVADAVGGLGERGPALQELLAVAAATCRGAFASDAQKTVVEDLVARLESANPTEAPVETDGIDGEWVLVYASGMKGERGTGKRVLGLVTRPVVQVGQVRQTLSVDEGRLVSEVDVTLFPEVSGVVKTTARVTPVGGERLEVGVEKTTIIGGSLGGRFDLGGLSFDLPVEQIYSRIKGTSPETVIDTTYLDDKIRISRSKTKLFVYARA